MCASRGFMGRSLTGTSSLKVEHLTDVGPIVNAGQRAARSTHIVAGATSPSPYRHLNYSIQSMPHIPSVLTNKFVLTGYVRKTKETNWVTICVGGFRQDDEPHPTDLFALRNRELVFAGVSMSGASFFALCFECRTLATVC